MTGYCYGCGKPCSVEIEGKTYNPFVGTVSVYLVSSDCCGEEVCADSERTEKVSYCDYLAWQMEAREGEGGEE